MDHISLLVLTSRLPEGVAKLRFELCHTSAVMMSRAYTCMSCITPRKLQSALAHAGHGMPLCRTQSSLTFSRRGALRLGAATVITSVISQHKAYAAATEQAQQIPTTTLSSGYEMPLLGLGTWRSTPDSIAESAVETAIKSGYRNIDTAKVYGNEEGVGAGIANALRGGVRTRDELFVVTKLFNDDHARDSVMDACSGSLQRLGLQYLDLYLVHWPCTDQPGPELRPPYKETWEAMEKLVDEGLVRSIGVSNMTAKKLEELLSYARIKPAVNQIEIHPYWRNQKTVDFCNQNGIHTTAYSPLGSISATADTGARLVVEDPTVINIAQSLGKTPSQVLLRWLLQQGHSAIPKAATNSHIINNLHLFDFELPQDAIQKLSSLEHQERTCKGDFFLNEEGPYRTLEELWDGEGY